MSEASRDRSSRFLAVWDQVSGASSRPLTCRLTSRAASEVFGTDALKDSTVVHRTRFGLDLAREFAKNIPNTEIDFKRDLTSVAMPTPKVTLATFALSVLPTARSRADLLQHLLDTDAEHIVLVDLSGEAGWTAMKQARKWFLAQSTESSPLHITAPCPHDGVCPRIDMLEPCAFSQRVQRPAFTRKTKHAKRGEEDVTYSYLIVSRGKRPSGPHGLEAGTGRMGAVGKEAMARALAKLSGRTEMREVEGGDGELEVVELPLPEGVTPIVEDADPEATRAALAAEAYSWPRLVAPPMKRSGHVVMDACTVNERLERFTVAKSLGKQSYYDARKSGWGDLWPHGFKGAVERKRGIRRLTDPNVEDLNLPSEREEAPVATATEMDVDSIIADLAKTALVKGDGGIDDVFEASYNFDFDAARDKAKAQSKLHRPTEGEKERGREREKREKAKERKAKLRNARLDKSERRQWRDADTRTVREFEAELDEHTAPPPRAADLGEGMQGMGEALGRGRKRRGPGFPFNTFVRGLHTSARALSVAPGSSSASPSAASARQKVTASSLQAQHVARDPITMLTAYDFPTALLCARAGIDIILVGDSMAQVCLGYDTTLPLTLDETIHHTRAVARGAGASFLLVDMPFGYVAGSLDSAVAAAVRLVKEGGADGLKIEGGREIAPLVSRLASFGVPVMPHIGLQPQRVGVTGYRAQGRNAAAAADMIAVAREMEAAGAFALLIEAVPHHVGSAVAEAVNIPTIGIGAGPNTSGQVLVLTDVVGTLDVGPEAGAPDVEPKLPKFVRQFGAAGRESRRAVDAYIAEVKARTYPAPPKETYGMPKEELEEFRRLLKDMGLGKAKETVGESKA